MIKSNDGELTPEEKCDLARAMRIIAEEVSKEDPLTPDQVTALRQLAKAFGSKLEAQLPHIIS